MTAQHGSSGESDPPCWTRWTRWTRTSDDFLVLLSLAALLVKHVLPGRGTPEHPALCPSGPSGPSHWKTRGQMRTGLQFEIDVVDLLLLATKNSSLAEWRTTNGPLRLCRVSFHFHDPNKYKSWMTNDHGIGIIDCMC